MIASYVGQQQVADAAPLSSHVQGQRLELPRQRRLRNFDPRCIVGTVSIISL